MATSTSLRLARQFGEQTGCIVYVPERSPLPGEVEADVGERQCAPGTRVNMHQVGRQAQVLTPDALDAG